VSVSVCPHDAFFFEPFEPPLTVMVQEVVFHLPSEFLSIEFQAVPSCAPVTKGYQTCPAQTEVQAYLSPFCTLPYRQ